MRTGPTGRWLCLGIAALIAACAPAAELGRRHQPSHLATPLPTADFDAYVVAARQYIAAANQTVDRPLSAAAVANRGPFELGPRCGDRQSDGPRAALLIHDLGGSPYLLRDIGRRLAQACYRVRAVLLPGHGGVPGDLLTVDYAAWQDAVRKGVQSFAGTATEVTLVGFGVGGTLALDYALSGEPPDGLSIAALVLLAPALGEPASGLEVGAQRIYQAMAPRGGWRALGPSGAWPQVFPDDDPVRYQSMPRNARQQRDRLTLEIVDQEHALDLPVFMAISADDADVDAAAARRWFCGRVSGRRQLIWYTSAPARATACPFAAERTIGPADGVLDLSHIGLPVDPDDPIYGRDSGYRSCLHYYWEVATPSWFFCSDPAKTTGNSAVRYGEISDANLRAHIIRRLTYNPDFDHLAAAMVGFLDGAR